MKNRHLGNRGLTVSEIGFGCMGLSDFYRTSAATEAQGIALIHRAVDHGATFLDTADAYGPFANELMVGKALLGRRDRVVVATKFGMVRVQDHNGRFIGIGEVSEDGRIAPRLSLIHI